MNLLKKFQSPVICMLLLLGFACKKDKGHDKDGCSNDDSDDKQRAQQEVLLAEATSQAGMPGIKNFRERKLLKQILELRDQEGLVTYTYLVGMDAKLTFLCDSIGFAFPYATQYTNPLKPYNANFPIANADPNGLFSPSAAEGSWILCVDPLGSNKDTKPVYVEPRIIVSPFRLIPVPAEASKVP